MPDNIEDDTLEFIRNVCECLVVTFSPIQYVIDEEGTIYIHPANMLLEGSDKTLCENADIDIHGVLTLMDNVTECYMSGEQIYITGSRNDEDVHLVISREALDDEPAVGVVQFDGTVRDFDSAPPGPAS